MQGVAASQRPTNSKKGKEDCSPGVKQCSPCSSWGSSWSQDFSDSVPSSPALANSKLARCHSKRRRASACWRSPPRNFCCRVGRCCSHSDSRAVPVGRQEGRQAAQADAAQQVWALGEGVRNAQDVQVPREYESKSMRETQ